MSKTESFEQVMEIAQHIMCSDCELMDDFGSLCCEHERGCGDCGRAMADRLRRAHEREIRDTAQQEYDRGFHDGQHSMDAEHRVIAMRLRGLRFDGGSHENLARIAYAIYPCATGWTCESAAGLRDKLIDLMGGVSDENVHAGGLRCDDGCMGDVSNGEDTGRTHDSSSNLDRNHMAVREGIDTVIGDSDGTCDSQYCGACAAVDCDCTGEQTEVSDGRCEWLRDGTTSDSLIPVWHYAGKDGILNDGRVADDCGADTCCGGCGGDLHLDGLDEERRRVVAELRRLDADKEKAYICGSDIAHAIGLDYGDTFLGRLAYLIGGDRPSMVTYDVLWNERHKAIAELRKMTIDSDYYGNYQRIALAIGTVYDGESFASECVRDRLIHLLGGDQPSGIDVLREMDAESDADGTCPNDDSTPSITDELRKFKGHINAGLTPEMVLALRAEINGIADRIDEQFDRICQQHENVLQKTIAEVVDERDELSRKLEVIGEYGVEVSDAVGGGYEVYNKEAHERDELQAKLDEYDHMHVELPKDANGEVFRVGCTVKMVERHPEVLLTIHSMTLRDDGEWLLYAWDDKNEYSCNLSTLEFEVCEKPQDTAESIVRDLSIGGITESEAIERIEALNG